jgi:integrase/DNA-directed RNA polymerase subunit RPC12/RpoP
MICTKCKQELDIVPAPTFCPYCGKKLISTPKARRTKSRGNGTGCAYYDSVHRYWVAQVVTGYRDLPPFDLNNPENRKSRIPIKKTKAGFRRREDALAYCKELKNQKPALQNKTLKEIYDLWEPWYSPRVDPDTFGCYRAAFAYFKTLHNDNIRDISAADLQKCLDDCPKGHRTHQNMKCTAGLLWSFGIDNHYVDKDITRNLFVGKGASVQREPLDDMEVEKIRKMIGKDRYASYVYALCYLGYRPGEMLEIKKDQVREHNGSLYIVEGKKTEAGRDRIVPVHPKIESIIRQQLATKGTDYLFPMLIFDRKGTFRGFKEMNDNYFNKYAFRPLADRLGIPKHKVPYSARHTFSDKLKDAEGTDKTKAALIGHSDYKFTQKKYQSTNLDELMTAMESIK